MKRPLLGITFVFCLGILSAEILNIPIFYFFLSALTFLFLSLLFIKSKRIFLIVAALGFLFLGAFVYRYHTILPKDHIKNILSAEREFPKHALVKGQVLNKPDNKIAYFNQRKSEFLLNLKTVKIGADWQTAEGILSTQVFNPQCDFKYGDEVILEGDISLPRPATNPGQFDYKKFLERKKIFYILKVKERDFCKVVGRSGVNIFKFFAYKTSAKIEALINKFIPSQEGAILNAILLGRRSGLSADINDNFINTGTVHILSISGLHVGLLASIFILLFKLLRLPFRFWAFILAALLIFYCIMVDVRPPITRATIMILVFLFGRILKREQDSLNSLAFSALVILFFNPQDLFDIGFQLSFLTIGSIIYLTPKLENMFLKNLTINQPAINHLTSEKIKRDFIRALLVSFSAWLGSVPFIARYFNIISPITLLANLFVVPWMFFVLASSITFILFGLVSSLFGLVFSQVASLSILILIKMVSIFSNVPFSYFRVKSPSWIFIIGFYAPVFLFFNRGYFKIKAKYFLAAMLVFLNIFIWHRLSFKREDLLKISFLDVGKGDSIFLEFPKGGTVLIDGGEGLGLDMGRTVVSRFLAYKGVNNIDVVLATHPHTDHIGGLVAILKNFKVRFFIDNGDSDVNPFYPELQNLIRQKKIKRFIVGEGSSIKGFGEIEISVLNPPVKSSPYAHGLGYNLNDDSLVLKLKDKDFSVLFCGDIKEEAAKNLVLRQSEKLPSTVVKIPHHGGSLGDIGFEFLKEISPRIAVVSLGNRDVHKNVLDVLNKLQTQIYRTDKDGTIFLTRTKDKYFISIQKR